MSLNGWNEASKTICVKRIPWEVVHIHRGGGVLDEAFMHSGGELGQQDWVCVSCTAISLLGVTLDNLFVLRFSFFI